MSSIVFVVHGDKEPITVWAHGTKSILGVNGLKRVEKESYTFTFLAPSKFSDESLAAILLDFTRRGLEPANWNSETIFPGKSSSQPLSRQK